MPICKCFLCSGKDQPLEWFGVNQKTGERFKRCDKSREYMREYSRTRTQEIRERKRQYYKANSEHIREYQQANREYILERKREYRQANGELLREYEREYRQANHERLLEQMREYKQAHPDKHAALEHKRRARIKGNGGSFTSDELRALFEAQNGLCAYCGKLLYSTLDTRQIHIEHKIPIIRGGSNYIENIAYACADCNSKKHKKTHEEFLAIESQIAI